MANTKDIEPPNYETVMAQGSDAYSQMGLNPSLDQNQSPSHPVATGPHPGSQNQYGIQPSQYGISGQPVAMSGHAGYIGGPPGQPGYTGITLGQPGYTRTTVGQPGYTVGQQVYTTTVPGQPGYTGVTTVSGGNSLLSVMVGRRRRYPVSPKIRIAITLGGVAVVVLLSIIWFVVWGT